MEAKELKIGNYVFINNDDFTNKEYHKIDGIDIALFESEEENKRFESIPLTEEILLKCGFEKIIVENYPLYIFDGFMIEIYDDNCVVCYNNIEITKLKFVHSLQNLYFSIKLKELLCDNI